MIPVIIFLSIAVFSLMHLIPGDPVLTMLGENATHELVEKWRHDLGLDLPVYRQYFKWVSRMLRGDFGDSITTGRPIVDMLRHRLPITLYLASAAILFSFVLGLPAGIISARWPNSPLDTFTSFMSTVGIAMPSFWLGILLIFILAVKLHLLPTSGYVPFTEDPLESLKRIIMPAMGMGAAIAAVIARQTRSSMLEVLSQDYIRTARAKGLREVTVLIRHTFKNALFPIITISGLLVARAAAGTVIVETIFAIPGMGRLLVNAMLSSDFPLVQGTTLILALGILFVNLVVDLSYAWIDPRVRYR